MNASNNFTVVGFICKDAEVRNFEKSSIARFGVSIKTTEKKGGVEITSSSIQSFETWLKNEDQALLDLLKKGKRVKVEGFFKSETYQKDGKDHHVIKLIATSLSEVEKQKEEEKAATQKHFLLIQGSPTRKVVLNRWHPPKHQELDINVFSTRKKSKKATTERGHFLPTP